MATLEKIRNKAGLLVVVVGVALFAFIIGDFLNSGSTFFQQSQEKVLVVDGENINIQDYQLLIDEMADVYRMQMGTNNLTEDQYAVIRQSVYASTVQNIILQGEFSKLGMKVTSEELFDRVQGENISPMIIQSQMFTNPETGQFDKISLLNFLKAIDDDNIAAYPIDQQGQILQARNFWLFLEKNIKRQAEEEKYSNLLSKAITANVLEAQDNFKMSSRSVDLEYVMQAFATVDDSEVAVSKSEIEKYYNQRKERFKQENTRIIDYIAVDIAPSAEDYDKVLREFENILPEFTNSENIAELVNEYSDIPYVDAYFSVGSFDAEIRNFVENAEIGQVEPPFLSDGSYRMFKLLDKKNAPDSVKISHIMLVEATEVRTMELADSLLNVLKSGADFFELAMQYSVDQTAQTGGDLGWFTEIGAIRSLSEEFKNAAFNSKVGDLNIVKTMYGTHIVKATETTRPVTKYRIADIEVTVTPSSSTYSELYNNLNAYVSNNNSLAKFAENAADAGYQAIQNIPVTDSDERLSMFENSRQVIRWAFQNDKGKISDIFECGDKYIVATVKGSIPKGYTPLSMVEDRIRTELMMKKKGEKIVSDLKTKNLSSTLAYADAMNADVLDVKFVTFNTANISSIGAEPIINGYVAVTPENQITEPFAGNNGVYVIKPVSITESSNEYDEATQLGIASSRYSLIGMYAVQNLIDKAKIEDNRIRFY